MKTNSQQLLAEFGPETRFEVQPAPFPATRETQLEHLKNQLLKEKLWELAHPGVGGYLRRAANEALALAQATAYPLLLFPSLFEERTEAILDLCGSPEVVL